MNDINYMQKALEEAEENLSNGGMPFAVVVVDNNGQIVWKDHDRVQEEMDPTAHAELNAIRGLCKKINSLSLNEYIFYVTSEPCPTCMTAMIKAQVPKVFYGAKTEITASLPIPAEDIAKLSKKYPITIIGGILEEECLEQRSRMNLKQWSIL